MAKVSTIGRQLSRENSHPSKMDSAITTQAEGYSKRPSRKSFFRAPSFIGAGSAVSGVLSPDIQELMEKIPPNAETAQVFVGTLSELKQTRFAMVRLAGARLMPELLEAPIPIRFLFVILGPKLVDMDYHELGRSVATLMSNSHFHEIAYQAENRNELVSAIDDFLDASIVIPPGEIDSRQLLSVDAIQKALRRRMLRREDAKNKLTDQDSPERNGGASSSSQTSTSRRRSTPPEKKGRGDPLKRTGRPFGGLVDDIRFRFPQYCSDFRDALHFQCIASVVFMFFAAFAPAITFGGLMGSYTNDTIGISETLLAQFICGIVWSLFSAQPLLVMSPTGPVLIFEASLYKFCEDLGLDFLTIRVWTGIWLVIIALVTVLLEGSFLVRYVTRFTEDIFATLISVIFIAESVKFVIHTFYEHPVVNLDYYNDKLKSCSDVGTNETSVMASLLNSTDQSPAYTDGQCLIQNQPDTGLLTAVLLVATFVLSVAFKKLRTSFFLGNRARSLIGDFGVLIAIMVVSLVDVFIFPSSFLTRLDMPSQFGFTNMTKRGGSIFVPWILPGAHWYGYLFALVPALLVYILLFVETEITELLLSKKERGLRKGSGFHWDLLLVGLLTLVCSMLGLPWMCAAAVQSLAHASSLAVMKRHAPGERPSVDYVIEQRVTNIGVSILIGACSFAGSVLRHLPLSVLFGVFLYLGVMNLLPVQFIHRLILFLIPEKYFPDYPYCQNVRMTRMHLFTGIQLSCLAVVYLIKHFKKSSLAFPFVLMLVGLIRRFLLPKVFSEDELTALEGHEDESVKEDFYEDFEDQFPYAIY